MSAGHSTEWAPRSNGTAFARPWFLVRIDARGYREEANGASGNLRRFASRAAAQAAADKLNAGRPA